MLQSIRDGSKGGCAWVVVGFITIPFALWGIQEYIGGGQEPAAAQVNGTIITDRILERRVYDYKDRLKQQLGKAYRADLFDDDRLKMDVLKGLIQEELILQTSNDLGMQVSNKQVIDFIRSMPNHQLAGKFDLNVYQREIASLGYSEAGFESKVRSILLAQQLRNSLVKSAVLLPNEIAEMQRLTGQLRDFDLITFPVQDYVESVAIVDTDIESYYKENTRRFMAPEKVKLEYVEFKKEDLAAKIEVADDALQQFYQANLETVKSNEKRQATHILLAFDDAVDEAVLKEQAVSLKVRIEAGEDFTSLAKELSKDAGTADIGGDLGLISKGDLGGGSLEEAIFGMQLDEVQVVKTDFGFHVLKLNKLEQAAIKSFEDSKEELRLAFQNQEADKQFYDAIESLKDQAYEESGSLEPAAASVAKEVQVTDWLERDSTVGLFAYAKVQAQAFSEDVLDAGNNSEVIEISSDHVLVLRVNSQEDAAPRALSEVKSNIETILKNEKGAELSKQAGETVLSELRSGKSISDIEKTGQLTSFKEITRKSNEVSFETLQKVFQLKHPVGNEKIHSGITLSNGDYIIIELTQVADPKLDTTEQQDGQTALLERLSQQKGSAYFSHMLDNVQEMGSVKVMLSPSEE